MAKNQQRIKFEADVSGFKSNIKEAEKSITNLNNQLKLNQSQLKGSADNSNLLSQRIETLKEKHEEQIKVVENTRKSYEKAVEIFGENSNEAENLKNKLLQAETAEQNIKNEIDKTNQKLKEQTDKLITTSNKWQESGEKLKDYGSKIENVGNKLSVASGIVAGIEIATVKSAIGIETSIQQVEGIYGKASNVIKDFAENTAISFNMSKSEAYKYSQIFGNLIQSMTDDQSKNAEYTKELLKASAVIASSTGRTMEDVMDRIRSGLLGNTEAIEDLGVNVNVSLLESTDAFKKFAGDKSWNKLDFQTQQQIRLFAILEQTTKKYGDEVQKNTNTNIQQLTAKTKNLATNLGQKLLPVTNKVLDKVNDLTDNFENLNDEEQKNILKLGGLIAISGPGIKIVGKSIATIGKIKTGIGTLTGAIGVLKNGTEGANKSSIKLANTIKSWINPFSIATASIGAAYTILSKATSETNNYAKACKKSADETEREKNEIEELRNSIDEGVQTDLNHIDRAETLWKELQKITDENGNIKTGYEERAKVITGELSQSLGTEIEITDNVITKYKELQQEIDTLILKKKGEAILSGSEKKYNNAINEKDQKMQELIDKETEYDNKLQERNKLYNSLSDLEKRYYKDEKQGQISYWSTDDLRRVDLKKVGNLGNLDNSIKSLSKDISDSNDIINGYTNDIAEYEYNLKLFTEGTTESIQTMVNNVGKTYEKNGKTVEITYQRQIQAQQRFLETAKEQNSEALKNHNETEQQKTQITINEVNERIRSIISELANHTNLIEDNSEDVINAWKSLAADSYDIYVEEVTKMPIEMRQKIQEITGVVIDCTPQFLEVVRNLAQNGVNALDKNEEFRAKAIQSLQGYLQGLSDNEQMEFLKEAGIKNAETVMEGLKQGDLSEENAINILKGMYNGLGNKDFLNNLYKRATDISTNLSKIFTIKSTVSNTFEKVKSFFPGHKDGLDYVPYDNYIARLHKGERVLTAEENKDYMYGNIENKVSNRNITVQFFPQTMSEAELQRAETYIARKWGMAL